MATSKIYKLTRMKSLAFNFRIALSAFLCCVTVATTASAQGEAASGWVKVTPPDEAFTVMMPRMPFPVAERGKSDALKVEGQRYSLRHDDAEYMVWSFNAANLPAATDSDRETNLDHGAQIAWNLMIEPQRQKLKHRSRNELMKYYLIYDGVLPSSGHPGRRYRLGLGERRGMTHIYAAGSQIYIVAAAGEARELASVEEFIKSFTLNLPAPEAPASVPTGTGTGSGEGSGGSGEAKETDYNRTFTAREVTQKARILAKPEPLYTQWAREFVVTGAVRLRLVLRPSGEVGNITPIHRLPHGLTQQAIEAARGIRFEPAEKDGRKVAQYITFEYNFNIY
jgi:hypothetical protein